MYDQNEDKSKSVVKIGRNTNNYAENDIVF